MEHTIQKVPSNELTTIDADQPLISAIEKMFEYDYSQLGVTTDGVLIGMVSYRSISRFLSILKEMNASKELPRRPVRMAIKDLSPVVSQEDEITDLLKLLRTSTYVLVEMKYEDYEIITNYDLLDYLEDSIEPFLLIEDIERSIRELLKLEIDDEEIRQFFEEKEVRTPSGIQDCSIGHYAQFFASEWEKFDEYFEQQNGSFAHKLLKRLGDIRNDLFHFRTNSYESEVEEELVKFSHDYFKDRVPR